MLLCLGTLWACTKLLPCKVSKGQVPRFLQPQKPRGVMFFSFPNCSQFESCANGVRSTSKLERNGHVPAHEPRRLHGQMVVAMHTHIRVEMSDTWISHGRRSRSCPPTSRRWDFGSQQAAVAPARAPACTAGWGPKTDGQDSGSGLACAQGEYFVLLFWLQVLE